MSVVLNILGKACNLTVIYYKPPNNKIEFIERLDSFLESISTDTVPHNLCGGINIHVSKKNLVSEKYANVVESNGFKLVLR